MKLPNMRKLEVIILTIVCLVTQTVSSSAQETFDVVTYTAPKGWQKSVETNAIQFTKQNGNKIAIMMLFKSIPTAKDSKTTFDASWDSIVKELLTKVDAPQMQSAIDKNGWKIESGVAIGEKDGEKVAVMLLSATGGGKVVNLLVLYNSESFQTDIEKFVSSINLPKVNKANTSKVEANNSATNNASLVGLWVHYNTESSGLNSNGFHMLTGGYMRREYLLKADGTYVFRAKDWMVYVKDILYIYETGRWSVNGNQLTITPTQGKGEWWSKSGSRTNEWGNFVKASSYKLEKVTYTFEPYNTGNELKIKLRTSTVTQRDGSSGNSSAAHEFWYESRALDKSLIDNPPSRK